MICPYQAYWEPSNSQVYFPVSKSWLAGVQDLHGPGQMRFPRQGFFKSSVNEGPPCKKIGAKRSLPWVTQAIERLICKRDSLYQKQKSSKRSNDKKHFVNFRHLVKAKIKQAYDNYLEDVLGLRDISSFSEASQSKFSTITVFFH